MFGKGRAVSQQHAVSGTQHWSQQSHPAALLRFKTPTLLLSFHLPLRLPWEFMAALVLAQAGVIFRLYKKLPEPLCALLPRGALGIFTLGELAPADGAVLAARRVGGSQSFRRAGVFWPLPQELGWSCSSCVQPRFC